jgi:hypothetical protein
MRTVFFHASGLLYRPGDVIPAGNWGRVIFGTGPTHPLFYREYLFERVRREVAPDAPSRMASAYVLEDRDAARRFAEASAHRYVYVVELIANGRTFRGDLGWIDMLAQWHSFEGVEHVATSYWRGEPASGTWETLTMTSLIARQRLSWIPDNGLVIEEGEPADE